MDVPANLTDPQLVRWATKFGGWQYFYMNDQLQDPQGGLTLANCWDNIGRDRRDQIRAQMMSQATAGQLAEIQLLIASTR